MTSDPEEDDGRAGNRLVAGVARYEARRERGRREGERPLGRNLALIGSIGWLTVLPPLIGALLGRWLDARFTSGVFWSASLIFAGAILGGAMAWRRIERE